MTHSFNLVHDPWIVVRTLDHRVEEVSLRDVFARAVDFRGLGGELPSQEASILRTLLAIMLRATTAPRDEDAAIDAWQRWWDTGSLPLTDIDAYLTRYAPRFELFDEEAPFMQVATLSTASGNTSGLIKLIAEVPDGEKYFSLRQGAGLDSISPAEAARWLIHAHSFDTSGIKTGVIGDPRVKGGRVYPLGTSYAGNLGLVLAEGATLLETLLLNLCLDRAVPHDSVPWEREPASAGMSASHPMPTGPADLFTWQNRRIRLIGDGNKVTDAVLTYGDQLRPENLHGLETMSSFKLSENLSRREKRDILWPVRHNPDRSIWRGLGGLTAQGPGAKPHVIEWLANLRINDVIPDTPVLLRTIGVEYGPQSSTIARIVDDAMVGHVSAFTSPNVLAAAIDAAAVADDLARAYVGLLRNLDKAAAAGDTTLAGPYAAALYGAADPEFREWFSGLRVDSDLAEAQRGWQLRARQLALSVGRTTVEQAGPAALRGRMRDDVSPFVSRFKILDAASALHAFEREVALRTPLVNPQPIRKGEPSHE